MLIIGSALALSGCSNFTNYVANFSGPQIDAYHSTKTKVVCFSSAGAVNVFCMPDSEVDTSQIANDKWVVA